MDSGLERKICAVLDADDDVVAWVKNHKLFLEIPYLYFGLTYRYRPDFVVRLTSGLIVLLEGKGDPDEKDDAKATAARRWVEAVNTWGGLGTWVHAHLLRRRRARQPAGGAGDWGGRCLRPDLATQTGRGDDRDDAQAREQAPDRHQTEDPPANGGDTALIALLTSVQSPFSI